MSCFTTKSPELLRGILEKPSSGTLLQSGEGSLGLALVQSVEGGLGQAGVSCGLSLAQII